MGKFGLVYAILSKQFCPGAEYLKVKKPVHVREMGIHLHLTGIRYTLTHVFTSL